MSRDPTITNVPSDAPPNSRGFFNGLRTAVLLLLGQTGDAGSWATRNSDLAASGAFSHDSEGTLTFLGSTGGSGTSYDMSAYPTPITGLTATSLFAGVFVQWNQSTYTQGGGEAYVEVFAATGASQTFSSAVRIGTTQGNSFIDAGQLGVTRAYWVKSVAANGNQQSVPSGGVNGVTSTIGLVGGADLGPLIVQASNLASSAVDLTKFANGLEPVSIVSSVPSTVSTQTVFNTTDSKLYRWNGTAYTAAVPTVDLNAPVTASQLSISVGGGNLVANSSFELLESTNTRPAGYTHIGGLGTVTHGSGIVTGTNSFEIYATAATTSQFGLTSYGVTDTVNGLIIRGLVNSNPNTGLVSGYLPNTTYCISFYAKKTAGAGWSDLNLTWANAPSSQVAITNPNLTTSYQRYIFKIVWGATVTSNTGEINITVVGNTAIGDTLDIDNLQVEQGDTATAYSPAPTELLPNSITNPLIAAQAITAAKIAANTITAGQIAGNTITAGQIAGGTITATQLAAGAVTAGKIATNTIVAGDGVIQNAAITNGLIANLAVDDAQIANVDGSKINANSITASQIASHTITATNIVAGTLTTTEIAAATIATNNIVVGAANATVVNSASGVSLTVTSGAVSGVTVATGISYTRATVDSAILVLANITIGGTTGTLTTGPYRVNVNARVTILLNGVASTSAASVGADVYMYLGNTNSPGLFLQAAALLPRTSTGSGTITANIDSISFSIINPSTNSVINALSSGYLSYSVFLAEFKV